VKVTKRKASPAATAGVGVGIALLIGLLAWFVLISPQRSRAASLDEELVQVEQQISESRAAQLQSSGAQPIRSADLFRLTKAMPANNDIAGVMLELSRVAAETGIVFESIKPQATSAAGTNRAQPIELIFTGNFYSLSDFLYRLRNLVSVQKGRLLANGRLFAVEKLVFTESPDGFPHIRAFLTVSAFLYGKGPVAGAPPAPAATPSTDATSTDTTSTTTDATSTTTAEVPPASPEAVGP
jgi:Tfp pilus assembly protein PilN